jgi:hypothetical protein
VNDFRVAYLDAIDESLLDYLDEENELSLDAVHRLRLYATELLNGRITPAHLVEDWPDWFHLAPAFAAAYVPVITELETKTTLFRAAEESMDGRGVSLTPTDRTYLTVLAAELDTCPERRDEAQTGEVVQAAGKAWPTASL